MSVPYRLRPGAGFVLVVLVLALTAVFLGWGLSTPALDQIWRLQVGLETGRGPGLTPAEFDLFQATLTRHPALAESLLAERETGIISAHTAGVVDVGWAYLVRRTSSERPFLRVLAAVPTSDPPLVQARTMGAWGTKPARADSAFTWRLPDTGPFPQLVEVRVEEPPGRRGKRGAVPVLVTLAEAP